jgi:hypothetical protein
MLTDEELESIDEMSIPREGCVVVFEGQFDALIAQAREANKLRAENERLTGVVSNLSSKAVADMTELANAKRMLTLFGNQMAEAMKVVEAAERLRDLRVVHACHHSVREDVLVDAIDAYRTWLATHPHVNYAGTITVNADGTGR